MKSIVEYGSMRYTWKIFVQRINLKWEIGLFIWSIHRSSSVCWCMNIVKWCYYFRCAYLAFGCLGYPYWSMKSFAGRIHESCFLSVQISLLLLIRFSWIRLAPLETSSSVCCCIHINLKISEYFVGLWVKRNNNTGEMKWRMWNTSKRQNQHCRNFNVYTWTGHTKKWMFKVRCQTKIRRWIVRFDV